MPFDAALALPVVFASLALGLAAYVAVLEGLWLTTRTEAFLNLRGLWAKACLAALAVALLAVAVGAAVDMRAPSWAAAADGFPYRHAQLALSAALATSLLVAAVSAARLWTDAEHVESCLALKMAVGMLVICAPLEIAVADWPRPPLILGIAGAAALLGLWGGLLSWRGSLDRSRLFLAACILISPVAILAPIAEWSAAPH